MYPTGFVVQIVPAGVDHQCTATLTVLDAARATRCDDAHLFN